MRKSLVMIAIFGLVAAAPLLAQHEPAKPGPEHAMLKKGEGTWDAVTKAMGKESKGTLKCWCNENGLWALEHYKGEIEGQKFEGHGATSYDPATKKYVNVWIDSMSTRPMLSEGDFDASK